MLTVTDTLRYRKRFASILKPNFETEVLDRFGALPAFEPVGAEIEPECNRESFDFGYRRHTELYRDGDFHRNQTSIPRFHTKIEPKSFSVVESVSSRALTNDTPTKALPKRGQPSAVTTRGAPGNHGRWPARTARNGGRAHDHRDLWRGSERIVAAHTSAGLGSRLGHQHAQEGLRQMRATGACVLVR